MNRSGPGTPTLVGLVKEFGVFDFPFLIGNEKEADAVLDGPFGKKLMDRLQSVGIVGTGFRHSYRISCGFDEAAYIKRAWPRWKRRSTSARLRQRHDDRDDVDLPALGRLLRPAASKAPAARVRTGLGLNTRAGSPAAGRGLVKAPGRPPEPVLVPAGLPADRQGRRHRPHRIRQALPGRSRATAHLSCRISWPCPPGQMATCLSVGARMTACGSGQRQCRLAAGAFVAGTWSG